MVQWFQGREVRLPNNRVGGSNSSPLFTNLFNKKYTEQAVPERAVPERAVPERAVPERAVPERAVPERAVPERAILETKL